MCKKSSKITPYASVPRRPHFFFKTTSLVHVSVCVAVAEDSSETIGGSLAN